LFVCSSLMDLMTFTIVPACVVTTPTKQILSKRISWVWRFLAVMVDYIAKVSFRYFEPCVIRIIWRFKKFQFMAPYGHRMEKCSRWDEIIYWALSIMTLKDHHNIGMIVLRTELLHSVSHLKLVRWSVVRPIISYVCCMLRLYSVSTTSYDNLLLFYVCVHVHMLLCICCCAYVIVHICWCLPGNFVASQLAVRVILCHKECFPMVRAHFLYEVFIYLLCHIIYSYWVLYIILVFII
jgi:hypothetical protein